MQADREREKRELIRGLESARRGPPARAAEAPVSCESGLREQLRVAQQTCALLEEEMQLLEQKALAAISEAGRLRRRLDELGLSCDGDAAAAVRADESVRLSAVRAAAKAERDLLTDALQVSESEISRLARSVDCLMRKFQPVL